MFLLFLESLFLFELLCRLLILPLLFLRFTLLRVFYLIQHIFINISLLTCGKSISWCKRMTQLKTKSVLLYPKISRFSLDKLTIKSYVYIGSSGQYHRHLQSSGFPKHHSGCYFFGVVFTMFSKYTELQCLTQIYRYLLAKYRKCQRILEK